MVMVKRLIPEEYSEDRKRAMQERDEYLKKLSEEKQLAEVKKMAKKENKERTKKNAPLVCSLCNKTVGVIKERQLNKFGTVENTLKTYECRDCRKNK